MLMKPARAASRRFLPGSPFNVLPVDPPVEQFAVRDRVTHDKYGLGWVVLVEDDDAVIVVFGSRKVRVLSPFARLTKSDAPPAAGTHRQGAHCRGDAVPADRYRCDRDRSAGHGGQDQVRREGTASAGSWPSR
jgi:hypothetical protein